MSLLQQKRKALLVLEDGAVFFGFAFAGQGEAMGEVVFNTGMTGYQEVLTDPSYKEQIVTMTYPLIGNYGINDEDMESSSIHLEGLVVKEYQDFPSNFRSKKKLSTFLEEYGKIGIEGIDTRALTRRIRIVGAMRGILSTETEDVTYLLAKVRSYPGLVGRDLVSHVTCGKPYRWHGGKKEPLGNIGEKKPERLRVVVLDCGVKFNILRNLEERGCEVIVVPAHTTAREILSLYPDGLLLSNGPGDPAPLGYIVNTVRELLGKVPLFGICLGHQLLGLALGGRTVKLKFGHHGVNQPTKNCAHRRVEITSQNHGFVVLPETLSHRVEERYRNLNDGTSEGFYVADLKAFSVQYHPEAAPGPHDATYLFDEFLALMGKEGSPR